MSGPACTDPSPLFEMTIISTVSDQPKFKCCVGLFGYWRAVWQLWVNALK